MRQVTLSSLKILLSQGRRERGKEGRKEGKQTTKSRHKNRNNIK